MQQRKMYKYSITDKHKKMQMSKENKLIKKKQNKHLLQKLLLLQQLVLTLLPLILNVQRIITGIFTITEL